MSSKKAVARIGALIKAKCRECGLGLRAAAEECGVSPSTLSRLERSKTASLPDSETLAKLAMWLNVTVGELLTEPAPEGEAPALSTPEVVEVHLRADKRLSPKTAEALARMFKMLYDQLSDR